MLRAVPDPVFALLLVLPARTGQVEASAQPVLRPGQRLLVRAPDIPGVWNELAELLEADFSDRPADAPLVLLDLMPPLQLLQALQRKGYGIGVYLPAERPLAAPVLGEALPPREALDLLRKLHTLGIETAVLADARAVTDPHHYAELLVPLTRQLHLLRTGATEAQADALALAWLQAQV